MNSAAATLGPARRPAPVGLGALLPVWDWLAELPPGVDWLAPPPDWLAPPPDWLEPPGVDPVAPFAAAWKAANDFAELASAFTLNTIPWLQ